MEGSHACNDGATAEVLSADDVRRALTRIAHEIVERNHGIDGVVLVGLAARRRVDRRRAGRPCSPASTDSPVPVGSLDVSFHRDDVGLRPIVPGQRHRHPGVARRHARSCSIDDVLFTGRTVRAALEALNEYGRPRAVQLAVIVDRGHRELPIRPDYVGKNLPTAGDEDVQVTADGVVIA